MAVIYSDWIGESTPTNTDGDITLGGSIRGFAPMSSAGAGEFYYTIVDGEDRETGVGTYDGNLTFSRDTVIATLVNGVYTPSGARLVLSGSAQIYGTINSGTMKAIYDRLDDVESVVGDVYNYIDSSIAAITASDVGALPIDGSLPMTGPLDIDGGAATDPLLDLKSPGSLISLMVRAALAGTRKWYVGVANASGDVALFNDTHNVGLLLQSGKIESSGGPIFTRNSTGNWRIANTAAGSYGSFWHQDPTNLYLMLTNVNDQMGSYSSLRPFRVTFGTGLVTMENGLSLTGAQGTANESATRRDYVDTKRTKFAGAVGVATDWNTVTTPGGYSVATFGPNGPSATYDYGVLLVEGNGTIVSQLFVPDSSTRKMAYRCTYNSANPASWRAWQYIAGTASVAYEIPSEMPDSIDDLMSIATRLAMHWIMMGDNPKANAWKNYYQTLSSLNPGDPIPPHPLV